MRTFITHRWLVALAAVASSVSGPVPQAQTVTRAQLHRGHSMPTGITLGIPSQTG